MSRPADRRGFLRGLAGLPLIGGGIGIIGAPTAVAEPVTAALLTNYETWLTYESHRLASELRPDGPRGPTCLFYTPAWEWHRLDRESLLTPSTRAALVLSAVGVDWREGGR